MRGPCETWLPVCDKCGHIGKLPTFGGGFASWCEGPAGGRHKKCRMRTRRFVAVEDGGPPREEGLKEYTCSGCGGAAFRPASAKGRPPKCDACRRR